MYHALVYRRFFLIAALVAIGGMFAAGAISGSGYSPKPDCAMALQERCQQ
jgi:hypothetical protein